ncbi:MAG: glycosyltransferase [Pyrinomonadaceae bacterium]
MRILWLKTELLHPVDKGGKIRTYQMLKELKKNHDVTYLTLDDGSADTEAVERATEYCTNLITIKHAVAEKFSGRFYIELAINSYSQLPYALEKYVSAEMRRAIVKLVAEDRHDILICDFLAPAVNVPDNLPIPTLLFQHNVEAMIWRRHFEFAKNPIKRAYLKGQWRRMSEYERQACRRFDRVIAVSPEDAESMKVEYAIENISDVPTGVDTDYFAMDENPRAGKKVVFTGSMDWLPNEDAIIWFAENVWPRILEEVSGASLVVVGRNPSTSIVELGQRSKTITVTGSVPDVRPYMADASVFVVPIRIGGGTRLKIFEAMAMGIPVVSTTVGAEGLSVKDGVHLLLRNDPAEFAAGVVELLKNMNLAGSIGRQAAEHVRTSYGWANVAADFAAQCDIAIGKERDEKGSFSLSRRTPVRAM